LAAPKSSAAASVAGIAATLTGGLDLLGVELQGKRIDDALVEAGSDLADAPALGDRQVAEALEAEGSQGGDDGGSVDALPGELGVAVGGGGDREGDEEAVAVEGGEEGLGTFRQQLDVGPQRHPGGHRRRQHVRGVGDGLEASVAAT
jgi:hypothetical protein